jgi:hypothetical protein
MKRTLVRYKIKPEQVQENARLIKLVFQELKAKSPDGARYVVLQLDDGTFVHFATVESTDGAHPITSLEAFRAFQSASKSVAWTSRSPAMRLFLATIGWLASEFRLS